MNRLLERWRNFWDFVRDHIAEDSRIYKRLRIENGIPELEEELGELRAQKEAFDQYREEDAAKVADARNIAKHERVLRKLAEDKMLEAQQDTAYAMDKLAVSIPLAAVDSMVQTAPAATVYVNADDHILFMNKESIIQFREKLGPDRLGKTNLWEVLPLPLMRKLRGDIERSRYRFEIKYPPFQHWYVGIGRDEDRKLVGYLITNERHLAKKLLQTYFPAIMRVFKEKGNLLLPEQGLGFET